MPFLCRSNIYSPPARSRPRALPSWFGVPGRALRSRPQYGASRRVPQGIDCCVRLRRTRPPCGLDRSASSDDRMQIGAQSLRDRTGKKIRARIASAILALNSPARSRTRDPVVNSHLLCQLSYRGMLSSESLKKLLRSDRLVNTFATLGVSLPLRRLLRGRLPPGDG